LKGFADCGTCAATSEKERGVMPCGSMLSYFGETALLRLTFLDNACGWPNHADRL